MADQEGPNGLIRLLPPEPPKKIKAVSAHWNILTRWLHIHFDDGSQASVAEEFIRRDDDWKDIVAEQMNADVDSLAGMEQMANENLRKVRQQICRQDMP